MQRLIILSFLLAVIISCHKPKNKYLDISDKINLKTEKFDTSEFFIKIDTIIFYDVFGSRYDSNPKSLSFEVVLSIVNNDVLEKVLTFRDEDNYLETYFYSKYEINLVQYFCYIYNYRLPVNEKIESKEILKLNLYSLVFNEFAFGIKDDYLNDIINYLPFFEFFFFDNISNMEIPIYFCKDSRILILDDR